MIKKILKYVFVLLLAAALINLARQDTNSFQFWVACVLSVGYVGFALKANEKTKPKPFDEIKEGEDIKFVDFFYDDYIKFNYDDYNKLIEPFDKHNSKFMLFCDKKHPQYLGYFLDKSNGNDTIFQYVGRIEKENNTYKLYDSIYHSSIPIYNVYTDDNGKIECVEKIKTKLIQA